MTCPTKEQYEKAMKNVVYLKDLIAREYKHRENLIDELCNSQEALKEYKELLESNKEITDRYQIYQEILAENGQ